MSQPWSSELAGALRRDREGLLVAFVELRARLRASQAADFVGGGEEHERALAQTDHDYASLP